MKSPIVILFVTGLFFCQAKAELRQSYDLESLIQITEKNHIQIKKADSKILEMAKEVQLSNARFFPEVSLQSTQSTNQLLLKQNIYDGGASIASSDISTENKSLSEWDRKKQFKNLKELVTETYYHGLLIRQHKLLLESNSKLCENALEYAQKQMKFRSIGRDTLLRAKVEYRKSRAALFEVKRSERLVSQLLSKLTRLRDFELENLKGDLAFKDIEPPFEKKTP
ncbi:MAG: TolC family protein [Pseudobdellovibrionaceae bacterium]